MKKTTQEIVRRTCGRDTIYADTQLGASTAIALGNAQSGSGQQGDWLTGGGGDDTLIDSTGDDVLMGGAGTDLLIGGAGDDDIVGDGGYEAQPDYMYWEVRDTPAGRVFVLWAEGENPQTGVWESAGGAADVIYAGEGNDHAWGMAVCSGNSFFADGSGAGKAANDFEWRMRA